MGRNAKNKIVMLITNPATFDQRPLKEAHYLCSAGKAVTILAWDRERETKSDIVFRDGLTIKRMRLGAGHGTPVLTVPKLAVFYLWCLAHLLSSSDDAIHCHDVDTLPVGFAAKVLKLRRPKLVYDMHDLPEAFLRFFPLSRFTQRIFLESARKLTDAIVVVNDRFVVYLTRLGFEKSKLIVVMNAPSSDQGRGLRKKGSPFSVLYYGWLGEERGVKLLIGAMEGLEGISLSLAGRGELTNFVKEAEAKNPAVKYLGWLKIDELQLVIERADIIPSLYEPRTRNALMATPGKLLTAMSMAVPSLVPAGTYQAEIVEKFKCGLVVDWKDPGEVRTAIRKLAEDDILYAQLSAAAYEAFRTSFSWEAMGSRLDVAYDALLASS